MLFNIFLLSLLMNKKSVSLLKTNILRIRQKYIQTFPFFIALEYIWVKVTSQKDNKFINFKCLNGMHNID